MYQFVCDHCGKAFQSHWTPHSKRLQRTMHHYCSKACVYASPLRILLMSTIALDRVPFPDIRLPDLELGYMAGCIDGEGSFSVGASRNQLQPNLSVANNDTGMLNRLLNSSGVGHIMRQGPKREHFSQTYRWNVSANNHLLGLLPILIPALTTKKQQAEFMLEMCQRRAKGIARDEYDNQLRANLMQANHVWPLLAPTITPI